MDAQRHRVNPRQVKVEIQIPEQTLNLHMSNCAFLQSQALNIWMADQDHLRNQCQRFHNISSTIHPGIKMASI